MATEQQSPVSEEERSSIPAIVSELKSRVRGRIVLPEDPDYNEVRAIWNGMIDRRPAAIIRCCGVADVMVAVDCARRYGIALSVRGGGHNVAGSALIDDGLVVDLSEMRSVRIDPDARIAYVAGGARLGDLDHEAQAFGLAAPVGVVSATGVAGLTLHGGLGFLTRKLGLSCDSLIGADVVTASGERVRADETTNPDLLWALRGGGGNFGVVTGFEFRLHPVGPMVFMGITMYAMEDAVKVLRFYRDFMADAPDELMGIAVLWNTPDNEDMPEEARGVPACILAACWSGPIEQGEEMVQPLRSVATPLVDLSGPFPYLVAQTLFDPDYPNGRRYYWKSTYLREVSDEAIATIVEFAGSRPSPISSIDIWTLGGAMARVPASASAFARRDAPFLLGVESNWEDPSTDDINIKWTRDLVQAMERFSDGGTYLNFPGFGEEGEDLLRTAYAGNYRRLQEIKARFDPGNFFRSNFNIPPANGQMKVTGTEEERIG